MKFGTGLMAGAALLAGASAASAGMITQTVTLHAEGFIPYYGSTPIDPIDAVFTISYDPSVETTATATGITVDSANFPTLTPKFTYIPAFEYLVVATKPTAGGGFITNANGDYGFAVSLLYPPGFSGQYIAIDGSGEYYSRTGSLSVRDAVSSAPEPATWAMLIAGFGLGGSAVRRRATPRITQ